jgi:hypothetical protein
MPQLPISGRLFEGRGAFQSHSLAAASCLILTHDFFLRLIKIHREAGRSHGGVPFQVDSFPGAPISLIINGLCFNCLLSSFAMLRSRHATAAW